MHIPATQSTSQASGGPSEVLTINGVVKAVSIESASLDPASIADDERSLARFFRPVGIATDALQGPVLADYAMKTLHAKKVVIVDDTIFVTNLALPLTMTEGDEPEEDVTRYTISRIDIPKGLP